MKRILLLVTSLIVIKAFAQDDFRPGYIIENNGNVINGLIEYKPNFTNYKTCFFKNDSLAEVVQYTPDQLRGYRFLNSKYYVTKSVRSDKVQESYFLECLISGKATVYYMYLKSRDYYFVEKDSIFQEINNDDLYYYLEYEKKEFYYIPFSPDESIRRPHRSKKSNQYKGALKALFYECPELYPQIEALSFDRKSLINISKTYHENVCKDEPCVIYEKETVKYTWDIGIFMNSGIQSFIYDARNYNRPRVKLEPDLPLGIGLLVQASNRDVNDRLYLGYALSFRKLTIDDLANTGYLGEVKYKFNFSWLDNEMSLLYKLRNTKAKVNPYVSLGIPFGILLDKEGNMDYYVSNEIVVDQHFMIGLKGGAGLEYKMGDKATAFFCTDYQNSTFIRNKLYNLFFTNGFQFTLGFLWH